MNVRNLIDFNDLTTHEWYTLYDLACDIIKSPSKYRNACSGKIMATLFYEPSTRTQLSFQTAMLKLGGSVIGFSDPNSTSISKGESLRDTVKIISNYADIAVIRNPIEGAAYAASLYSRVPLINAGDGGHLHPTQTMADLFTIAQNKNRYENLNIGFCGDLLNGRTVHSLLKAFTKFKNNTFYLISTDTLKIPDYVSNAIECNSNKIYEIKTIDECIGDLDILYMTRIQRERFKSVEEYRSQSGIYILNVEKMKHAKPDMCILHPLPKVDEIEYEVDDDPRAKYFEQAENGMYMRMALILDMCEKPKLKQSNIYEVQKNQFCKNPRCITNHEKYLPEKVTVVNNKTICEYCEHIIN